MKNDNFRMLRTFSYVLALLGWLIFIVGAALTVMVFWQPTGINLAMPNLMGSAIVTATTFFVAGVFLCLSFLACSEKIIWMLAVNEHLQKIQKIEEFFAKASK